MLGLERTQSGKGFPLQGGEFEFDPQMPYKNAMLVVCFIVPVLGVQRQRSSGTHWDPA